MQIANCKEDIEYDCSKYEHKFSEEKVISATQILHGERNGSNVIDAEDNQIIQNTGYTVKKLTDVPNVTNISSRTMLHKPCHKVLDSLKGHLIVADDLICGNMFCNPSYGLWFIGFSLSVLFAYIRIEKSDTIVSLIFGSIFYIIIGGCFGTGLSLVMNAICRFLNLYPAYRFNKYLWRHIGRRNSKAIFNMIKRMGVTVSEYCWAMQLTLPPGSVWRYIVENAVAENDRKKKKRLIAYRKVTTSDILIILFLATLFLFNIYIILYGSDEEGTVSSSVIAIIDSMILFWAFIGIWTIRRVVWISREASVLGFIRSETSRGTFKPVLSIPGLFFIRTGELAQKGINYTVLAILAFLMSLTKRKK